MKPLRLSPSKLNLLNDCERCFWDAYAAGCPRPRGIFPSLPSGMDSVIKTYLDGHRGSLPPVLKDKVEGVLMEDIETLNKWRNWRSGLVYKNDDLNVTVIGALDDCLMLNDPHCVFCPFDAKTKGSSPKDDGSQYYQTQLDTYCLMLDANGFPAADFAYLAYFSPREALQHSDTRILTFDFNVQTFKIETNKDNALKLIEKACNILRGSRPPANVLCEYCEYHAKHDDLKNVVPV